MMSIEELERAFLDIDFQANRIAKSKQVGLEHLKRFNERSEQVRIQLIQMGLSDALTESLIEINPIDENFLPQFTFGRKILNVITFGFHKKRYIPKNKKPTSAMRLPRKADFISMQKGN